jgi:hypothetical protein
MLRPICSQMIPDGDILLVCSAWNSACCTSCCDAGKLSYLRSDTLFITSNVGSFQTLALYSELQCLLRLRPDPHQAFFEVDRSNLVEEAPPIARMAGPAQRSADLAPVLQTCISPCLRQL